MIYLLLFIDVLHRIFKSNGHCIEQHIIENIFMRY